MIEDSDGALTVAENEVKDMICRVAARGAAITIGPPPDFRLETGDGEPTVVPPDGRSRRRRRRGRAVVATLVAVAVVVSLVLVNDAAPPSAHQATAPPNDLQMALVDSTSSPFQSVGGGPQTGQLVCVTASTCYASDDTGIGYGWEVTHDGGSIWHRAPLPDRLHLDAPLSCPTVLTCVGEVRGVENGSTAIPTVAWTSDGGAHWRIVRLPAPGGGSDASLSNLASATSSDCVVYVTSPVTGGGGGGGGSFEVTTDAGSTWTAATAPAPLTALPLPLWTLRCQAQACIGLTPIGSAQAPQTEAILTVRSADGGRTWTATTSPLPLSEGILHLECGDVAHCLLAFPTDDGKAIELARTSDAGQTWTATPAPAGWPEIAISLSCADGEDCYLSAANYARQGYDAPAIEATHDGGATWTAIGLPRVDGHALALVFPLSCPVAAGCIGIGATQAEFAPPRHDEPPTSPNTNRVIVSNLPRSSPGTS